jgi:hypothetical protein
MRIVTLVIIISILSKPIFAQPAINKVKRLDTKKKGVIDSAGWKRTGVFTLAVNQSALSDWSTGGENFMIGINGILNKSIHHRYGKYSFDAYLDLELGVVEASSFKKFRKTTDRLDLTGEFEHSLGKKHFNYGLLLNLNTQLFPGHNYFLADHPKISGFFSPGKILISAGIDYKNHDEDRYLSVFISPLTVRWITKLDHDFLDKSKFGVDSAHKVYTEIGPYFSVHITKKIGKNVNYTGRLDLFSNYKRKPQNVDVLFNNLLSVAFSRIFAATVLLDIIYDDDIRRRTQIQEIFGMGLKFNL